MKNTYNPQSSKKRDLANHTLQVCQTFYDNAKNLSENFPGASLDNLYEANQDKIDTLKVELRLNGLLTEKVEKGLDRIFSKIKLKNLARYERHLYKLRRDLSENI